MKISNVEFLQSGEHNTPRVKQFQFHHISASQLPPDIFQQKGSEWSQLKRKDVESASSVAHKNGVVTYRISLRPRDKNASAEVFFVDYFENQEIGYARIIHDDEMSFSRNIYTKEEFGRRGLAVQRLLMANQYSFERYKQPLYSGLVTLKEGRRLWKSLIAQGLAEPTGNLTSHMYRFKTPPPSTEK